MVRDKEHIVMCWKCNSPFNVFEASFCNHNNPTLACPFCLFCACEASDQYIKNFFENCPEEIINEKKALQDKSDLRLGELLLRAGKIAKTDLDRAITLQNKQNKQLGQILISMGLLTHKELSLYLIDQKWIDKIDLTKIELDFELVEQIGKEFCLREKVIPIEKYQLQNREILRLVIYSKTDIERLRRSKVLEKYIVIPYEAATEDIDTKLKDIKDYDVFVLR
jgi:hypothetical protein